MRNTIEWRVNKLEKNYEELDGKIDSILQNHLPSLKEDITSLKTLVTAASIFNIGAIIVGIIISKLFL